MSNNLFVKRVIVLEFGHITPIYLVVEILWVGFLQAGLTRVEGTMIRSVKDPRSGFDFDNVRILTFYVMAVAACSLYSAMSQLKRKSERPS